MQIVQARGREIPVTTRSKRYTPERARAEALFHKPAAVAKPRILEDAPKVAATRLVAVEETEHDKVFRLVREGKFEDAARLAARLINVGQVTGFFIYGKSPEFTKASEWHQRLVRDGDARANVHIISPERAQILLMHNIGNRRVNAANLAAIMRDIATHRFDLNGESIVVCQDGTVNDGQHRTFGVLLTGQPIESVVSYGVTKESMRTVNIGRKRTGVDRLNIASIPNAVHMSAISNLAFEMYNGRAATPAEAQDYYFENQEHIVLANSLIGNPQKGLGSAAPGVAALHLLSLGANEDDIRHFFTAFRTGEMLKRRNPIYTLREALREKTVKWTRQQWTRGIVHHFLIWRAGRSLAVATSPASLPEVI
ncbi:hypothetical protein [Brucella intermedia]|uniref:hypothetical protein n=1 Tax=Brucella intermedia TaxID=94625 RepID=UPI00046A9598|nr:hypothetical protein [Brucella intermedia]